MTQWNKGEQGGPGLVTDMTSDGRAVVKIHGRPVVFVPGGLPGDHITFTISRTKKSWAAAQLDEITVPSPNRIDPPCPHGLTCGGCPLMAYDHRTQIDHKKTALQGRAQRLGAEETVRESLCVPNPQGFRNHMQFLAKEGRLGLWTVDHRFGALDRCHIFSPQGERIRRGIEAMGWSYSHLREVGIRTNTLGEAAVILVTATPDPLPLSPADLDTLVKLGVTTCEQVNAVDYQGHYGTPIHTFLGDGTFREQVAGEIWAFATTGFFQTNTAILEQILAISQNLIEPNLPVVDLYCGVGVLGQVLAGSRLILGNEYDKKAVTMAQQNAQAHGLTPTYLAGPAETIYPAQHLPPHQLIVDPPRAGLHEKLIDAIKAKAPQQILYISCDQATLMRDLKRLQTHYRITHLQCADMFAYTAHVETVCLLTRK